MHTISIKSIDHYETFLSQTFESWSSSQRIAFAAAMAERWLAIYETFSVEEDWGDPANLRRSLDAVWNHAGGKLLGSRDIDRHLNQLRDSTPHMDDFDALEALGACCVLNEALNCCKKEDNTGSTVLAALSGFEAAVPDWVFDPEEQPKLWKQNAARKELRKQLKLIDQIGSMTEFAGPKLKTFRRGLTKADMIGEVSAPAEETSKPPGITNQVAFEQYRRMVESDLKTRDKTLDIPGVGFALLRISAWMGRYSRRKQTIDGSYGKLADEGAHAALVARQRTRDAAVKELPTWDSESAEMLEMCLANNGSQCDAKAPLEPHGYGLSMRRLWVQAKRLGKSDVGAWENIVAWAIHKPTAWDAEDRRKKKGQAYLNPELGEHLGRELAWATTGDVDYPWLAEVHGSAWRIRLNDFPDEIMYTLFIGKMEIGSFNDWPGTWQR